MINGTVVIFAIWLLKVSIRKFRSNHLEMEWIRACVLIVLAVKVRNHKWACQLVQFIQFDCDFLHISKNDCHLANSSAVASVVCVVVVKVQTN